MQITSTIRAFAGAAPRPKLNVKITRLVVLLLGTVCCSHAFPLRGSVYHQQQLQSARPRMLMKDDETPAPTVTPSVQPSLAPSAQPVIQSVQPIFLQLPTATPSFAGSVPTSTTPPTTQVTQPPSASNVPPTVSPTCNDSTVTF